MNQNRAIRQNEQPAPRKKGKGKPGKKRRTVFLPALFGITIAFALACMALCWMILNDSSNLMNSKADVTLGDYIGMTKEQAMATDQIASGQISPEWEEEYNSNYAAGYIYKQSPVSGRTVREGQSVTLTVSLGTQYVPVPDLTNYVQTDAEHPGGGTQRGRRLHHPHRPCRRYAGGGRLYGHPLYQSSAGVHHHQGALAYRHEGG